MSFWELLLAVFSFLVLVAWIWLLIAILGDLFRDQELSGWSKALWTLFIIVVPWLGTLVYVIARGRSMNERALARARDDERDFRRRTHAPVADSNGIVDELTRLAHLRDRGSITPEEFGQAKARLLGTAAPQRAPVA